MMKYVLCVSLVILLMPSAHAALPGDSANGKRLHDANCTGCHDSSVYSRKDRAIRSLDALKHQVQGCGHMAKKEFSTTELQDIVKYLDEKFYRFQ
jgi:cytochrome c5